MEIGKSIRFIPQQRLWPGGCTPLAASQARIPRALPLAGNARRPVFRLKVLQATDIEAIKKTFIGDLTVANVEMKASPAKGIDA